MIAFFGVIAGLFVVASLLYWWALGGVIPAIMLTLPTAATFAFIAVWPPVSLITPFVLAGIWTPWYLRRERALAPARELARQTARGMEMLYPDRSQLVPTPPGATHEKL